MRMAGFAEFNNDVSRFSNHFLSCINIQGFKNVRQVRAHTHWPLKIKPFGLRLLLKSQEYMSCHLLVKCQQKFSKKGVKNYVGLKVLYELRENWVKSRGGGAA